MILKYLIGNLRYRIIWKNKAEWLKFLSYFLIKHDNCELSGRYLRGNDEGFEIKDEQAYLKYTLVSVKLVHHFLTIQLLVEQIFLLFKDASWNIFCTDTQNVISANLSGLIFKIF